MRVLIVDDDRYNRDLLSHILAKNNIEHIEAENGKQALELLKNEEKFDAVISDILMPEMDGFQLTINLKENKKLKHLPIILYSSTYKEDEDKNFAIKLGVDSFLVKPAPADELISTLNDVVGKKGARKLGRIKSDESYKLYSTRLIKKLERKLVELEEASKREAELSSEAAKNLIKYRAIFDNANDALIITNSQVIIECNTQASQLFGLDKMELIGKSFWLLSSEYQLDGKSSIITWKEKLNEVHRKKNLVFEWTVRNSEGNLIDVEIGLSSFLLNDETHYLLVLRDLTERKQHAFELRKAYREISKLKEKLENENIYLKSELKQVFNFENILTNNEKFKETLEMIGNVSLSDSTVLILGETGTGKELIARAIHQLSKRNKAPLIKINCAAIPPTLIESELFGHEKGAFTGAIQRKIGRFEMANGGTLFLDEIGDLPFDLQTKLLRVLQEGEFERVGGRESIKVDVRIIAATNRDLSEMINKGEFRQDLFYRLNVFPVHVPPLRDRKDDIPLLVEHFVEVYSKKMNKSIKKISKNTLNKLMAYNWPGNIRELENIIERAVVISTGDKLVIGDWLEETTDVKPKGFVSLDQYEKDYIEKVLAHTKGKISGKGGAAEILGMKPTTLQSRMIKLGIKR